MKVEKREVTITKEEYFFVAEDGTGFEEEYKCRQYELDVQKNDIESILSKEDIPYNLVQESVYYEDTDGFYYIENESDIQNLWHYFELRDRSNPVKYSTCTYNGEGWYVYVNIDTDYESYYTLIKVDFKTWREWIAQFDWMKDVAE